MFMYHYGRIGTGVSIFVVLCATQRGRQMTARQRRRIAAVLASVPLTFVATGIAMADAQSDTATATVAHGANNTSPNPYAPSGVGQGDNQGNGNAPANGTVGNADNKNPPGQAPNGSDRNKGYECDKNKGVGNKGGNPAHSGCTTPSPSKSISPSPSSSPSPRQSQSPSASPSPSPSKSVSPTPSPVCETNCETQSPSPSLSPPVISGSPEAPVVCQVGLKCSPPPPPPPCSQTASSGQCLPFTGANVDNLALRGGLAVLIGLLMLALLNLETQVRKYVRLN